MVMSTKKVFYKLGGMALLSRHYSESKKALKGHCGSKGRKAHWRCKKRDGSKVIPIANPSLEPTETSTNVPTETPTETPTNVPTSAPSPSPTVTSLNDDNVKVAVRAWTADQYDATVKYGSIENWDVSLITNMLDLFKWDDNFNDDISAWNTEQVTSMNSMFAYATSFNQNISAWNTKQVTDMQSMFNVATSFNQDISAWNTEQVTDMSAMFNVATSFNQDISAWNTEQVTDMSYMLNSADLFKQNLCSWLNNEQFPNSIETSDMFRNSACPFPYGPFDSNVCFSCETTNT